MVNIPKIQNKHKIINSNNDHALNYNVAMHCT